MHVVSSSADILRNLVLLLCELLQVVVHVLNVCGV